MTAIKNACERLGFIFCENQTTYKWWGKWLDDYNQADAAYKLGIKPEDYGKCNHAIKVPNCNYEIGLVKQDDGYAIIFDFIDHKLTQAVGGQAADKLVQMYAVEAAKIQARKKGKKVKEEVLADGSIKLTVTSH